MKNDFKRVVAMYAVFKELGLDANMVSQAYIVNNSNDHPYHNFQHLLTVALRAFEGGKFYNLPVEELQALVIAGLTHDAMYVIGESEDVNIKAATNFSVLLCEENSINHNTIELVKSLIQATEFPHNKVESVQEQIIQDADLMQSLEEDCEKFLNGLCVEKDDPNIADPRFPGIDGFNTDWAKNLYSEKFSKEYA